jgi:hypothetical protein
MKSKNDSYIKEQKELRRRLMNLIAELDKAELDKKEQLSLQKSFKQETLEEAAEKYENSFKESDGTESVDFIEGANWQAERMYSEEEVMDMFDKFSMHLPLHYEFLVREMFKKK